MIIRITKQQEDRVEVCDYSGSEGTVGTFFVYDNGHEYIFETPYEFVAWFTSRYCASIELTIDRLSSL
jgi:hypothetical protein